MEVTRQIVNLMTDCRFYEWDYWTEESLEIKVTSWVSVYGYYCDNTNGSTLDILLKQ
jgi:hypothetical protein